MATSWPPAQSPPCMPLSAKANRQAPTQDPATTPHCPHDQARASRPSVLGRPHHPRWPGGHGFPYLPCVCSPPVPRLPFKLPLPHLLTCSALSCPHTLLLPATPSERKQKPFPFLSLSKILLSQGPAQTPHLPLSLPICTPASRDQSPSNSSSAYCMGRAF